MRCLRSSRSQRGTDSRRGRLAVLYCIGMEEANNKQDKILKAVGDLSGKFDGLSKKTDESIERLSQKTDALDRKYDALDRKTDEILGAVGEVLEAIGHFSDKTESRFEAIDHRFEAIEKRLDTDMVTKSYLDEKLFDLKGDLTVLMRKEDAKLLRLVDILETRKVITPEDVNAVLAMEPFPQGR